MTTYTTKKTASRRWAIVKDGGTVVHDGFDSLDGKAGANPVSRTIGREVELASAPPAPLPTISVADAASVAEGEGLAFEITRAGDLSRPSSFSYETVAGTAVIGEDLSDVRGTLDFAPGEAKKTITVMSLADTKVEGPESFLLRLSNPTGATLARAEAIAVILDAVVVPPPPPPSTDQMRHALGAIVTAEDIRARPNGSLWLDRFRQFDDQHWEWAHGVGATDVAAYGGLWAYLNYYDRAKIYYAMLEITGDEKYRVRAREVAYSYLSQYLEPSYNSSGWWSMGVGMALAYLDTKDERFRKAIGQMGTTFTIYNLATNPYDGRTISRVLENLLFARYLDAPSETTGGGVPAVTDWDAMLRKKFDDCLRWQDADGCWRFNPDEEGKIPPAQPFMIGLTNATFRDYARLFENDPRILPSIKRSCDWCWDKMWDPAAKAFYYLEYPGYKDWGTNGDPPRGAPDLNGLMLKGFAHVHEQTGDEEYARRCGLIMEGILGIGTNHEGAYLWGAKQFNQAFSGYEVWGLVP
jgi:hypothetical protein